VYVDEQFYSLSNTAELLRFPLVSTIGKLRLALTVLYCLRMRDWEQLEGVSVEEWLMRWCGRRTYEKFWKPLLLAKLGEQYRRVSAVFIWSYIKRAFSARGTAAQREHLGHVSGGYRTVLSRLEDLVRSGGGQIRLGTVVSAIKPRSEGGMWIEWDRKREHFDKVVCTSPVDVLERLASHGLLKVAQANGEVEYLGVICLILITRRALSPYYTLNIADARLPFTGVIGMSNVVGTAETAGFHLTYVPQYVLSDDPLLRAPDDEIRARLLAGLALIFPDLREQDIVSMHVNRAFRVQPLQVLNYSRCVPQVTTQHEDFFVLNTSQFVNCALNNNEVIRAVDEFLCDYWPRLERRCSHAPELAAATA
jgi:protoporphyrinogen oxidase